MLINSLFAIHVCTCTCKRSFLAARHIHFLWFMLFKAKGDRLGQLADSGLGIWSETKLKKKTSMRDISIIRTGLLLFGAVLLIICTIVSLHVPWVSQLC